MMKPFLTLFSLAFILVSFTSPDEEKIIPHKHDFSCHYSESGPDGEIKLYPADPKAEEAAAAILNAVGLKKNFEILSADVSTASSLVSNNKRYVLYNPFFMNRINREAGSKWTTISILAHEIGHHLNGHTFMKSEDNGYMQELEADEFSGFVLYKMGATLEEAQSAMHVIATEQGTSTHPPKEPRLKAIAAGWNMAAEQAKGDNKYEVPASAVLEETVPKKKLSDHIKAYVTLYEYPDTKFYITKKNSLVSIDENSLSVWAILHEAGVEELPYLLQWKDDRVNYVSSTGKILDKKGRVVGFLKTV